MKRELKAMEYFVSKENVNVVEINDKKKIYKEELEFVEDETSIYEYDQNCLNCRKNIRFEQHKKG